jgi:uncharacterized protein (DUF433 family)
MSAVIPEKVDLSKYIEMREGRPNIRGRRLPILFVSSTHHVNNMSIADLAYEFTITEVQVLAALLYYCENKEEVDAQDEDQRQWDEMKRLYDNPNWIEERRAARRQVKIDDPTKI